METRGRIRSGAQVGEDPAVLVAVLRVQAGLGENAPDALLHRLRIAPESALGP